MISENKLIRIIKIEISEENIQNLHYILLRFELREEFNWILANTNSRITEKKTLLHINILKETKSCF